MGITFSQCTLQFSFSSVNHSSISSPISFNLVNSYPVRLCSIGIGTASTFASTSWYPLVNDPSASYPDQVYNSYSSIGGQASSTCGASAVGNNAFAGTGISVSEAPTYNYSTVGYGSATLSYTLTTTSYVAILLSSGGETIVNTSGAPIPSNSPSSNCTRENSTTSSYGSQGYQASSYVYVCRQIAGSYSYSISTNYWNNGVSSIYGYMTGSAYVFPVSGTSLTTFTESGLPTNTNWSVTYNNLRLSANTASHTSISFLPTSGSYSYSVGYPIAYNCIWAPSPASGSLTAGNSLAVAYTCAFNFTIGSGTTGSSTLSISSASGFSKYLHAGATGTYGISKYLGITWPADVNYSYSMIGNDASSAATINDTGTISLSAITLGVSISPTSSASATGYGSATLSYTLSSQAYVSILIASGGETINNGTTNLVPPEGCILETSAPYSANGQNGQSSSYVYVCEESAGSYSFAINTNYWYNNGDIYGYIAAAAYISP